MKFKLWREHGALNSPPIFAAFEQGLKKNGHAIVDREPDIDVIWSVLWYGRMKPNKLVYETAILQNRPVMIIEVGNLFRGQSWRISLNNINGLGEFGEAENLDLDRPKKLGIDLKIPKKSRKDSILLACQHEHSLQWQGQPRMAQWAVDTVNKIRQYSDRKIVIRPHPRSPFSVNLTNTQLTQPMKIPNSYDDFNIDYDHHCVINYNSGPAVRAAIEGVPIICDATSLAWPISEKWENLENPQLPNRDEWLLKLCHTEWTVPELQSGIPQTRLINYLEKSNNKS